MYPPMEENILKSNLKDKKIRDLLEHISITSSTVTCYFKCAQTNKSIISIVPFEPYEGKIKFSYKDILLHPIRSYNKYYHTPIVIYTYDNEHTLLLKAFEKISTKFQWNEETSQYIYVI